MLKKFLSFLLALFTTSSMLFGQTTGKVSFIIQPRTAFLSIDNQVVAHSDWNIAYEVELAVGLHEIKIWASTRELYIDTIEVKPNENLKYIKALGKPSEAFLQYKKENSKYWGKRFGDIGLMVGDVGLTAILGILVVNSKSSMDDSRNMANERAQAYTIAVTQADIETARLAYKTALQDFDNDKKKYKTLLYIGVPIAAILNTYSISHIIKRKRHKLVKPVYQEDNPLVDIDFQFDPGIASGPCKIGFTLKF